MSSSQTLYDLAKALTKEERNELYRKITKSLSIQQSSQSSIYHSDLQPDQKRELILQDIQELNFWKRFIFWFWRLFSAKSDESVFLDMKMSELKHRVQTADGDIIDFDTNVLRGGAAARIFDIYRAAYPLIPMFKLIWQDNEFLEETIEYILEEKIPGAKRNLKDFFSQDEMEDTFLKTESKSEVRKELLRRYNSYINAIQSDLYDHIEDGILPLYYLKEICLFPFADFFELFNYTLGTSPPEETPRFIGVNLPSVIRYLEKLYYGLYTAQRINKGFILHDELILYYLAAKERLQNGKEEDKEKDTEPEEQQKKVNEAKEESTDEHVLNTLEISDAEIQQYTDTVQKMKSYIRELVDKAARFNRVFPLSEIIRFYHKDPYYRFLAYLPKLNLKEFYISSLKMRLLSSLDSISIDVRKGAIQKMINAIFHGQLSDFSYYRQSAIDSMRKIGLPKFTYLRSLNILYNFMVKKFANDIQNFIRILNRIIPERKRDAQNRLVMYSSTINDISEKIHDFDETFSPESDDGKAFFRLRYTAESDMVSLRPLQNLVNQKNREARSLIDDGLKQLASVQDIFREIYSMRSPGLGERYKTYDSMTPGEKPFETVISRHINDIELLQKCIRQVLAIEEGI